MGKYLRFEFVNDQPLRIADDSISQSGQTITLKYVPGTTIRGYVINELVKKGKFDQIKQELFSERVRFLNAYPICDGKELMPSPKGFYEDKAATKLENVVVTGAFSEGMKRAALGRFCYLDKECIVYYKIDTGSDMKIKMNLKGNEKRNVFRNEYIQPGNVFAGYIAVDDDVLVESIKEVINDYICLGNARSAGFGKCKVIKKPEITDIPYSQYVPNHDIEKECYLMLLSNATMRDERGEYCGINEDSLGKLLDVDIEKISLCSTSVVDVRGYNRTWGINTPSVTMYEMGSVFHLFFKGTIQSEKLKDLMDKGIGVRKNEGFGRVIVIEGYEKIKEKREGEKSKKADIITDGAASADDSAVIYMAAKSRYKKMLKQAIWSKLGSSQKLRDITSLSGSQLGTVASLITANKYDPYGAKKAIESFFERAARKEEKERTQKVKSSIGSYREHVNRILNGDIEQILNTGVKNAVMGIPKRELLTEQEQLLIKLQYLSEEIHMANRRRDEI